MKLTLNKTYSYKKRTIVVADNGVCEYIFIVGMKIIFGSVADAKKFLNGNPTTWSIIYTDEWENGFNEAVDALVKEHNL